jgi:hypothetical protein
MHLSHVAAMALTVCAISWSSMGCDQNRVSESTAKSEADSNTEWMVTQASTPAVAAPETRPPAVLQRPTRDQLVSAIGGEETVKTLRNASRVNAVRLTTPENPQLLPPHEYPVAEDSREVDSAVSASIVDLLLDPQIHVDAREGGSKPGCFPIYYLRLRYSSSDAEIDIYFCFSCDDVAIYANGERVRYQGIRFAVDGFLDRALEIFPDDPALKQAADRRTKPTENSAPNAESRDPYGDSGPTARTDGK